MPQPRPRRRATTPSSSKSGERKTFQEYEADKKASGDGSSSRVFLYAIGFVAVAGIGYAIMDGGGGAGGSNGGVLIPAGGVVDSGSPSGGTLTTTAVQPGTTPPAAADAPAAAVTPSYGARKVPLTLTTNVYGATLKVVPAALAGEIALREAKQAEEAAAEAAAAAKRSETAAEERADGAEKRAVDANFWPDEDGTFAGPAVGGDSGEEWPLSVTLAGDEKSYEFDVEAGLDLIVSASYGPIATAAEVRGGDQDSVPLTFEEADVQRLRKAATCQIRIPEGGFGSGFLYGDRSTIATAAHCVATRDVGALKFVFAPTEPDEEVVTGAEIVYFDANQDVALLTLPEPLGAARPYFLRGQAPAVGRDIVILGNPGRGAEPDPTYSRTAQIRDVRPDEFSLDIEVKPGYSGGPVVLADTFDVLGITSFKIVGGTDYENLGTSFAKGADIAGDAYAHWVGLDDAGRRARVERETERYARDYGLRSASEAARNMYIDSAIYAKICVDVIQEYIQFMERHLSRLPPMSQRMFERAREEAHEEFLEFRAPRLAERTRERVTPKLRTVTMSHYEAAIADETLDSLVKKDLQTLHGKYTELKQAAENITDASGSKRRGMTAEQFLQHVIEQFDDARYYYDEVIAVTALADQ